MNGLEALGELDRLVRTIDRWAPKSQETSGQSGEQAERFELWRDDPVGLASEVFGLRLWSQQAGFLQSIVADDRVAARSGHKVGKTLAIAIAAWWFILTRPLGRVIITAPTDRQVRKLAWREVRRLWRLARARGYDLPEPALAPDTGIQFADGREVIGFSTDVPENIAGFSAADLLVLVDEASGVAERIFEAIQGNLAGGAKLVMISNPTQTTGQFFEAFNRERAGWRLLHMSSEACAAENVGQDRIPGLAVQSWIDDRRSTWGVTDPRYQVRVSGDFARSTTNTVVSLGMLEAAYDRWGTVEPSRDLAIGVDVARFGDDNSVVRPVLGYVACAAVEVAGFDTIQVAGVVKAAIERHRLPGGRVSIRIDAGGGYGGGVADQLRAWEAEGTLGHAVQILEVHPSATSNDPVQYHRKRDELWFGVRKWLDDGGTLDRSAEPGELEEDLLTPTYAFQRASGAMKVEAKDEIKKRIGRSPDHGDAFALAVLNIDPIEPENDDGMDVATSRWSGMGGMGY